MALTSPPGGENENLALYKWQEKEISSTTPGAAVKVFEFAKKTDRKIQSLTGIMSSELVPSQAVEKADGLHEYYTYSTNWITKTGDTLLADCKIYFRKGGVDYLVSGDSASIASVKEGTTYIEVTFKQNVTATDADAVLLSYAYTDATNPEPHKYLVKDFDFSHNGRDYTSTPCIGGITFKRRQPLELTEISLTTLKVNNSLSSIMLGRTNTATMGSVSVKNMSGGNTVDNWALSLIVADPANPNNKLCIIATDIGATSVSPSGGVDSDFEETVSFKTEPDNYMELEYIVSA